jgi:hypothetical protein
VDSPASTRTELQAALPETGIGIPRKKALGESRAHFRMREISELDVQTEQDLNFFRIAQRVAGLDDRAFFFY